MITNGKKEDHFLPKVPGGEIIDPCNICGARRVKIGDTILCGGCQIKNHDDNMLKEIKYSSHRWKEIEQEEIDEKRRIEDRKNFVYKKRRDDF